MKAVSILVLIALLLLVPGASAQQAPQPWAQPARSQTSAYLADPESPPLSPNTGHESPAPPTHYVPASPDTRPYQRVYESWDGAMIVINDPKPPPQKPIILSAQEMERIRQSARPNPQVPAGRSP